LFDPQEAATVSTPVRSADRLLVGDNEHELLGLSYTRAKIVVMKDKAV